MTTTTKMFKYKMRAEAYGDILQFQMKTNIEVEDACEFYEFQGMRLPDCVYAFSSEKSLDDLRTILDTIPDGQVMRQTLQTAENYTGVRVRERRRNRNYTGYSTLIFVE